MSERRNDAIYYPRPAVLGSIPQTGHVVIEASAGTGKTFTIEHLVVDLLLESKFSLEQLLVVTFTEKATAELRERVRHMLRQLCESCAPRGVEAGTGSHWKMDASARARLQEALGAFDAAAITTIHGFCQRVLAEEAFVHGRLLEQELIDGREAFGRAFRERVRELLGTSEYAGEALAVLLRQGETLEAVERKLYHVYRERGVLTPAWDPEALLAARSEMLALSDLLVSIAETLKGSYAARTARSLGRYCQDLFERLVELGEASDIFALSEIFSTWAYKECSVDKQKAPRIHHVRQALGQVAPVGGPVARFLSALDSMERFQASPYAALAHLLTQAVTHRLEARKASQGHYDFDDMLSLVHASLSHPERGERLARSLRRRFRCALIDEFQDTDALQWEIFRRIFFCGDGTRLFLVGDPKQAIYGFRNADVHTYLEARHELRVHQGATVALRDNYRQSPALIEVTNRIFSQGFFSNPGVRFEPARCARASMRAVLEDGQEASPLCILHVRSHGALRAHDLRRTIGDFVAQESRRLVEGEALRLMDGERRLPLRYRDIFVLTRTANEGRELGNRLGLHGVPHTFYREDGLFQSDESLDVLALLRALAQPDDPRAVGRASLTPFFGLSLVQIERWARAGCEPPWLVDLRAWRLLAKQRAYGRLFAVVMRESGVAGRLAGTPLGERALASYEKIFEQLLLWAHRGPRTLADLCRYLGALSDRRRTPTGRDGGLFRVAGSQDAVQILTMHKAKGLEAAVVFVAGGATRGPAGGAGSLATYHVGGKRHAHIGKGSCCIDEAIKQEVRDEEERLLYVALTRAKWRLYLPYYGESPDGQTQKPPAWLGHFNGSYQWMRKQLGRFLATTAREDGRPLWCSRELLADEEGAAEVEQPASSHSNDARASLAHAEAPSEPDHETLRRQSRSLVVTSYTQIVKALEDSGAPGESVPVEEGGHESESPVDPVVDASDDTLPGGRVMGIFLHKLLEELDFATVLAFPNWELWHQQPDVQQILLESAGRFGIAPRHMEAASQVVHTALSTPLRCERLDLPRGLASLEKRVAEMSFVHPVESTGAKPLSGSRRFVQGVVDLVFEQQGRIYLLDWKSDKLAAWSPDALAEHVSGHYQVQVALYLLALVRLLRLESQEAYEQSFGGLLYCFLRGMANPSDPAEGVHFERPSWAEVKAWEGAMASPAGSRELRLHVRRGRHAG